MGRNKLTALAVRTGTGTLHDGGGLMLVKSGDGGKWVYRYMLASRRRDMGLGSYPEIALAEARKARDQWAALAKSGTDPIAERDRRREAERAARYDPTLAEFADTVFEGMRAGLRGDGARGRWFSPLKHHVLPKLGGRRLVSIVAADIRDALTPIWSAKPETAKKAANRLRIIFRKARLVGLDADPFTVEQAVHMLGDVRYASTPIAATPWKDVPALYARLAAHPTIAHLALQWSILTVTRGDGARGVRYDEIDGDVWTIPAERVKGREGQVSDFRVPLCPAALEIAETCRMVSRDGYLFPGKPCITSTALHKALNALGEAGRPHGFRTSFRTWVQDTQATTFDIAETILGHAIGNKIERTYARSDMLEQRRPVMDAWADFVTARIAPTNRERTENV